MTDYWRKYDETQKYIDMSEIKSKEELKERLLDEFFGGDRPTQVHKHRRYTTTGEASEKLADGLWRIRPEKEGLEKIEGYIDLISFERKRKDKRTGNIYTSHEERHVVRDNKTGRFKKWL
jgi:hypothetical protein